MLKQQKKLYAFHPPIFHFFFSKAIAHSIADDIKMDVTMYV